MLPLPTFLPVAGAGDVGQGVVSYAVRPDEPGVQLVTNGAAVQATTRNGCSWARAYELGSTPGVTAATARITDAVVLKGGAGLLVLRDGTASAARTRVLRSAAAAAPGYALSEQGLPAQGTPRTVEAAGDGRTVYLALDPSGTSGGGGGAGGLIPPVGGLPVPTQPPGLLYRSTDGGQSWELRTASGELGSGRAIDALAIDRADPQTVMALSSGRLLRSTDGGGTFAPVGATSGVRVLEALAGGSFAAFTAGEALLSTDGGASFRSRPTAGVTAAAWRRGDQRTMVQTASGYLLLDLVTGQATPARTRASGTAASLVGDSGPASTFRAVAGSSVLRFFDPSPPGSGAGRDLPVDSADLPAPPPRPGIVTPAATALTLAVGESRTVDYTLALPQNPTPLDVFFLVDTSPTMRDLIKELQQNITSIAAQLEADGIDLGLGLGIITTGARPGAAPYPEVDPTVRGYRKPPVYRRLRPISAPAGFAQAVAGIANETPPSVAGSDPPEGQVLALRQLVVPVGADSYSTGLPIVPAGQGAQFRDSGQTRKVVVHASDDPFINGAGEYPDGSPRDGAGQLDIAGTAAALLREKVKHIGLTLGRGRSDTGMEAMSRLTRSFAPPGGASCGLGERIPEGAPLVCKNSGDFGDTIRSALRGLDDRQQVTVRTTGDQSAVGAVRAAFGAVNVSAPNSLRFTLTYDCVDARPGTYRAGAETLLRGFVVGRTAATVRCVGEQAAVRPVPVRPVPAVDDPPAPPPPPGTNPVPAPAPPAPAAQPQAQAQAQVQTQVQTQVQVNPMTAAMLQQQEQLQLALALNAGEVPREDTTLAMVDRRRRDETSALALLAVSMAVAAGAGVARLRTQRVQSQVRRAR